MKNLICITLALFATAASAEQPTGTFEAVGSFSAIGGLLASIVAPGTGTGKERLYASFSYGAGSLDVLSIDPDTGSADVFHSPVAGESSAWNLAVGPNGNVFLGTVPTAHLMELDEKRHQLTDLGRPSAAETYIWDLTFGSDNRLYGATYPRCKLVRYDPVTRKLEDLGRMDPTEQYAHFIVASSDGFLYLGVGSSKANIAAYNIKTGQHREILPVDAQTPAMAKVFRGVDGNLYGMVGTREFRLTDWTATEVDPGHTIAAAPRNVLRDGRTLDLSSNLGNLTLTVTNARTGEKVEKEVSYHGEGMQLMRICFGPDGALYGSTAVPMDLFKADIVGHHIDGLGYLGAGEVYSFLSHGGKLLMASYAGPATLMSYSPGGLFKPLAVTGNPILVPLKPGNEGWRPMTMIDGPDGNVYVGSVAGYGLLNSPLIEWNTENNSTQQFNDIVKDESIISLASWHEVLIGGTSATGGEGSHATQTEARLFIWDPKTKTKEFDIVPVPGAPSITDLIAAPNGAIYGIGGDLHVNSATLFVFDPEHRKIITSEKLPFSSPIYNSVALGPDGRIWGLAEEGIFAIDTRSNKVEIVARPPAKIGGGFALRDGSIYFFSGSTIYRYKI